MKVAVTGSHGLIGRSLLGELRRAGHDVVRVVRSPEGGGAARWDPGAGTIDSARLEGVEAVVHLAGVGIGDRRWSPAHKQAVLDSRNRGTALIAETIDLIAVLQGRGRHRRLAGLWQIGKVLAAGDYVLTEIGAEHHSNIVPLQPGSHP
jgi:NAD(P)-dependent dehydrogenase (short-subunit alcohol dehydrogenase family)